MIFRAHCKLPLEAGRIPCRRVGDRDVCSACYDLVEAVGSNPHFLAAQVEYQRDQERLKRLLPGSNYLG